MSDCARSIFVRSDDRYVATAAALSPWAADALHGGPPAMLLARELEAIPTSSPMLTARLTVELLRRIGQTPLETRSRLLRDGKKVQLIEASLWSDDLEVARATALRIRRARVAVPVSSEAPPHPVPAAPCSMPDAYRQGPAYHRLGVETRALAPLGHRGGPGWAWFRLRLPLIAGEAPSPLVRLCAAADFGSGVSNPVDPAVTTYINPDLTINIHREPVGEWVCVAARTFLEPDGVGFAESVLYDQRGRIGRSAQSLLLEARHPMRG